MVERACKEQKRKKKKKSLQQLWSTNGTVSTIVCIMASSETGQGGGPGIGRTVSLEPVPSSCFCECLLCKEHVFMDFVNKKPFFSLKEDRYPCHLLSLVVLKQVPCCLLGPGE